MFCRSLFVLLPLFFVYFMVWPELRLLWLPLWCILWSDLSYDFYDYPLVYFMVCPELRLLWLPLWCIFWFVLSYDFYDYPFGVCKLFLHLSSIVRMDQNGSLSIKKKSHKEWYWSQAALDPLMDTYIYIISAYSFSVSIKIFDMFLYLGAGNFFNPSYINFLW